MAACAGNNTCQLFSAQVNTEKAKWSSGTCRCHIITIKILGSVCGHHILIMPFVWLWAILLDMATFATSPAYLVSRTWQGVGRSLRSLLMTMWTVYRVTQCTVVCFIGKLGGFRWCIIVFWYNSLGPWCIINRSIHNIMIGSCGLIMVMTMLSFDLKVSCLSALQW